MSSARSTRRPIQQHSSPILRGRIIRADKPAAPAAPGPQVSVIAVSSWPLPLDEDPETSIACSLMLHLMSEHGCVEALHMSEQERERRHRDLHLEGPQPHGIDDLRFRPKVALSAMQLRAQRHEAVQRLIVPAQHFRS